MIRYVKLASAVVVTFCADAASAAAIAVASGEFNVSVAGTVGDAVTVTGYAPTLDPFEFEEGDARSFADPFGEVLTEPTGLYLSTLAVAEAGAPLASAAAFGNLFDSGFSVENEGAATATITFSVDWLFEVVAQVDSIFDDAVASVDLYISEFEDGDIFHLPLSADSLFGPFEDRDEVADLEYSIDVEAGARRDLFIDIYASATASSVPDPAPIPLPAAGWLLGGAVAAFDLFRRRR